MLRALSFGSTLKIPFSLKWRSSRGTPGLAFKSSVICALCFTESRSWPKPALALPSDSWLQPSCAPHMVHLSEKEVWSSSRVFSLFSPPLLFSLYVCTEGDLDYSLLNYFSWVTEFPPPKQDLNYHQHSGKRNLLQFSRSWVESDLYIVKTRSSSSSDAMAENYNKLQDQKILGFG